MLLTDGDENVVGDYGAAGDYGASSVMVVVVVVIVDQDGIEFFEKSGYAKKKKVIFTGVRCSAVG